MNTPPYYPYRFNYEGNAARCDGDEYPVSFDDHIGEVNVPIFGIARRSVRRWMRSRARRVRT